MRSRLIPFSLLSPTPFLMKYHSRFCPAINYVVSWETDIRVWKKQCVVQKSTLQRETSGVKHNELRQTVFFEIMTYFLFIYLLICFFCFYFIFHPCPAVFLTYTRMYYAYRQLLQLLGYGCSNRSLLPIHRENIRLVRRVLKIALQGFERHDKLELPGCQREKSKFPPLCKLKSSTPSNPCPPLVKKITLIGYYNVINSKFYLIWFRFSLF